MAGLRLNHPLECSDLKQTKLLLDTVNPCLPETNKHRSLMRESLKEFDERNEPFFSLTTQKFIRNLHSIV